MSILHELYATTFCQYPSQTFGHDPPPAILAAICRQSFVAAHGDPSVITVKLESPQSLMDDRFLANMSSRDAPFALDGLGEGEGAASTAVMITASVAMLVENFILEDSVQSMLISAKVLG
jgi:hypothetical protein